MVEAFTFSVFASLSGLLVEGRHVLFRHCMRFGQMDPIVLLASDRLRSFETRMQSLVARWRAGKLVVRARKLVMRKPVSPPTDAEAEKPLRLPNGFGWLSKRIKPDGYALAAQLPALIADPEMMALIEATPQAGRLLRPLCHMYGVKVDAIALPRRERRPRRKPEPTPAQRERQAEREEAREQRELAKTSSKASVVPKGHTFPTTARGWAIWLRRARRAERKRRRDHFKSA